VPKMKTHRGAAKRFKVTTTGKIRRRRAFVNHMLGKKDAARKRRLRRPDSVISSEDAKRIRRMLGS
jgi:large subunit ribosomal protein L35